MPLRPWLALIAVVVASCLPADPGGAPGADAGDGDPGADGGPTSDAGPNDLNDAGDDVGDAGDDLDDAGDSLVDAGDDVDAGPPDLALTFGTPPLPAGLGRGLLWTRTHAPFLSALSVGVTPVGGAGVDAYFNDFHATAIHLWASGAPDELAGWQNGTDVDWVSWVFENGNSINGQVIGGLAADAPGRIGWQVGDEPLTPPALDAIGAGMLAVRAADPDALIYTNLCCADRIDVPATVDTLVTTYGADLVSYDQYDLGDNAWLALETFRAAARAHGVPAWRYMRSYLDANQSLADINPVDLRWDAYSGALYGFTGWSWFIYQVSVSPDLRPVLFTSSADIAAARTPLFDEVAAINARLGLLGETLTQLTSVDVLYVPFFGNLTRPNGTHGFVAGADPFLSGVAAAPNNNGLDVVVGLFTDDDGERYFAVQNPRHPGGDFPNANASAGTARLSFDFSAGGASEARVIELNAAGALVPVALQATGAHTATLDVTLDAGELRLFKYDTGAPFARRADAP